MKIRIFTLVAIAIMATTVSRAQAKKTIKKPAATAKTAQTANAMSPQAKALFEDMLPNTQKVFVIDSTIVDKENVLSAIPLPKAYGEFADYDAFFGKKTGNNSYVFVNGFGNRCYYTELGTDSISRLYMRDRLGDKWGEPVAIKEINDMFTDISYPYMASDGQTLYFAGRSASEGLGKRDIYMAKYDADEGAFMQAENMGLPFNSSADDYAYIVADADRMAWFATTRRQPAGKACVYAFVPAEQRENYSEDELSRGKLLSMANLARIRETWPTPEIRDKAMERLSQLRNKAAASKSGVDNIKFIVNDNTTYTSISQFRSDETRKAFLDLIRQKNDLASTTDKLDKLRTQYHVATTAEKASLARQIAALEDKEATVRIGISQSEKSLRRKENNLLKNN